MGGMLDSQEIIRTEKTQARAWATPTQELAYNSKDRKAAAKTAELSVSAVTNAVSAGVL